MVNNAVNQFTVLGTLVDRAVCMPYAKPQVLRKGRRRRQKSDGSWETVSSIEEDVVDAAGFIVRALKSPGAQNRWSAAGLALDPGGPWWPKVRNDFFRLDEAEREWVLDRLPFTAETAAGGLESKAFLENWSWLWSQPSLFSPGRLRPKFTIPDLIGGLDWKQCDIVDLKTTTQSDLLQTAKERGEKHSFEKWKEALSSLGFKPRKCWLFMVSSGGYEYRWVDS